MAACYAPDVHFSDPVFPDLRGHEAGAMWRMLTERGTDLRVELLEHSADGDRGSAHWRAYYTFTQTGRSVVNDVRADASLPRRAHRRPRRRLRLPSLGASGARPERPALGWTPLLRAPCGAGRARGSTSS